MDDAFLDASEIRATTFVRHVELHNVLGSTNDRAAELAADTSIELPALIAARHQTAGRGRGDHTWWSADGALTFSILLEPRRLGIDPQNWPQLSLTTAVAICDALNKELTASQQRAGLLGTRRGGAPPPPNANNAERAAIKWPNDIYLDGRKIAGILLESPGGPAPAKDRLIIGVGINVNNSRVTAPDEFQARSIALCDVTSSNHHLQSTLIEALQALQNRIHQLATGDARLSNAWQRSCWLTKKDVAIETNGSSINGVCTGIDTEGKLLVENANGLHRIHSGTVRVI